MVTHVLVRSLLVPSSVFRGKSTFARLTLDGRKWASSSAAATPYLLKQYDKLIDSSSSSSSVGVSRDEHQTRALAELDRLRSELLTGGDDLIDGGSSGSIGQDEEKEASSSSFFSSFFSRSNASAPIVGGSQKESPKGVYLHGGVGCGKTFCMDLFYESIPKDSAITSQKVHFHKFMLDVHKQMHEAKMIEGIQGDVIPRVVQKTVQGGKVLCFDEFQVTDVADALILQRLFTGLMDAGVVPVITSNRPPEDLYLNGIQRDRFLPFIDLLMEKLIIVSMEESDIDYRLIQGATKAWGTYFIGSSSKEGFDEVFVTLTKGGADIKPTTLRTQGRAVAVPQSSSRYNIARFSFDDLCRKPLGAADYLAIGETYHTVFIEDVPKLSMNDVNVVRRFIVFVDAMYECHVKLVIHAEAAAGDLFQVDLDNEFVDEAFAFDRTRSRLDEMGSEEYLKRRWSGKSSSSSLSA